jgi:predicted ATP-binding protein involved in virulence
MMAMLIYNLELKNFRCFQDYQLELAPRFTVLIGENGSGKTAILDALAISAGCFLSGIPTAYAGRKIRKDDLRAVNLILGQTITKEQVGETEVIAKGEINGKAISWGKTRVNEKPKLTRIIQTSQDIETVAEKMVKQATGGKEKDVVFPVLAYYGTGRLFQQGGKRAKFESKRSRFDAYQDCLDPAGGLKSLFPWFKINELAALQKRQRRYVLEAVRSAIIALVPEATYAQWDLDWDELVLDITSRGQQVRMPFHLLSDGYRNVVGMAGDIAYRMAALNPHLLGDAVRQTPGVVLIDELDLHLHPNWQRIVVGKLMEAFPKVQFIGTTHSPFIIQSLHGVHETLLWDLATKGPLAVESKSIEDIAENKQGVRIPQQSERFLAMKAAAEKYYEKLRQAKNAEDGELKQLRRELDELMMPFSDDPAYQAFLKMERTGAQID